MCCAAQDSRACDRQVRILQEQRKCHFHASVAQNYLKWNKQIFLCKFPQDWTYSTAQVQHHTRSHESICLWRSVAPFFHKYPPYIMEGEYSQEKWLPRPLNRRSPHREQIYSHKQVRRCTTWPVLYPILNLSCIAITHAYFNGLPWNFEHYYIILECV